MKKIAILSAFISLAVITALAGEPQIEFNHTSHDFGAVAENGGAVSYEFEFTNTGDEPLIIVNANASCGCTRPTFPKKPIAPGKKDKIKVTYLPQGRPGEFTKTVKIRTNAKKNKNVVLKINGFVTPEN